MRAAYIGIRTHGTTSELRSDTLAELLPAADWLTVDTDKPFLNSHRVSKSLAFRFRIGPAVRAINQHVVAALGKQKVDLAWIDKGVCLTPKTIHRIRRQADRMIYYTPDTSFSDNRSRFFDATAYLYDLVVTTKSFELDTFKKYVRPEKLMLVTQSFDENKHQPAVDPSLENKHAVLIGLCEPDREDCVQELLNASVPVRVGGRGWDSFASRHSDNPDFHYLGPAVFGEDYVKELAHAAVGLGLLTRRFPELHTTRTFEIPACGTALATPRNKETASFFHDHEVIFFDDYAELASRLSTLLEHPNQLKAIAQAGSSKVRAGGFSNQRIINNILQRVIDAV